MTARLILARHGNTFNPDDMPIWVGARTDLPLVEKGLMQAQLLGDVLCKSGFSIATVIAGPLRRTRQTAEIVVHKLNLSIENIRIDQRLTEIDYGLWEGKTNAEIAKIDKEKELEAWDKKSIFPFMPRWQPCEAQIIANIELLLTEACQGTSLIVTSNGILRFFARAAANTDGFPDRKVATGHICIMQREKNDEWHIIQWNQSPTVLLSHIST